MTTTGAATLGARALARGQLRATILASARAQLGVVGPAQLSVRAVARDVGMVSSAVYRYFPSRDELLTELLIICYDELGAQVEQAEQAVPRDRPLERWLAIAQTFRGWALTHPHDFALLYGSPVPGYVAPRTTIGPATRVPSLVVGLVADHGSPVPTGPPAPVDPELHAALAGVRAFSATDLDDAAVVAALGALASLVGALTLELFGHLTGAVHDHNPYFGAAMRRASPVGSA